MCVYVYVWCVHVHVCGVCGVDKVCVCGVLVVYMLVHVPWLMGMYDACACVGMCAQVLCSCVCECASVYVSVCV